MHRPIHGLLPLVAGLLLMIAHDAFAEAEHRRYGPWRSSHIGGGGYVQNVVPTSDPQRFYSYVDVAGAFRSEDGGQTWRQMFHGDLPVRHGIYSVRGLIADPRDPDHLLAATGTQWETPVGLIRSENGGRTWERIQEAVFFGNGPFRTAGRVLVRKPDEPDVILAGAAGALYRSTDNGQSWAQVGPEGLLPTTIHFDAQDPDRVWLGAQAATRWVGGQEQRSFAGGWFVSEDAGLSWRPLADQAPEEVVQDPVAAERLFGRFSHGRIAMSRDGGESWDDFMQGLPLDGTGSGSIAENVSRAFGVGPDAIFVGTGAGELYRLEAGADEWEHLPRREVIPDPWWYGNVDPEQGWVHFGKAISNVIVNPHEPDQWLITDWYAIWRTGDGGATWRLSIDGIEATVIHTLLQAPDDPRRVHLGMADNAYLRSDDGGQHWAHKREGMTNNVKDLALSPEAPHRLYATGPATHGWHANAVYRSDDAGESWSAVAGQGLPDMAERHSNSISVHPGDPDHLILGVSGEVGDGDGGVYRSRDGGASWSWIGQGMPDGEPFFRTQIWACGRELEIGADGSMVAFSRDHTRVMWFDSDQNRWREAEIDLRGSPFSVSADLHEPGRFYLGVSGDGAYRSDDGGRSWQRVWGGDAFHVRTDMVEPGRVLLGTSEGVYFSDNAGADWQSLGQSLPYKARPYAVFAGDRAVVGTTGTGVYWRRLP